MTTRIDLLDYEERLCQLAEEGAELSQAALKLRRAMDGRNPTPKTAEECWQALFEEIADVLCCLMALGIEDDRETKLSRDIYQMALRKMERWERRLRDAPVPD